MCPLFFIKFLFFHQMIALPKLWKVLFISSKKLFSFSRYSYFCNLFPSFPQFPDTKGQMEVGQFVMSWTDFHKGFLINLFQNIWTFKRISWMQWLFWVITKIKKGVWDYLLMHISCIIFPQKCFLFNTLSMGKVSMSYLFSFPRYQTKSFIKFLFRQLMSQTIRFILDQPLKQWLTGRKRGEDKNTKIWIYISRTKWTF